MRRSLLASFAAGAAAAAVALTSIAAIADSAPDEFLRVPDGKPPTLKVAPIEFIVGTTIDATIPYDPTECDFHFWHLAVPMRLSWTGADGQRAIDHYDVWAIPPSSEPYQIVDDSDQTSIDLIGGDYDSSCGDASISARHRVEAYDRDGNVAMAQGDSGIDMGTWQEDGFSLYYFPEEVITSRTGTWTQDTCTCSDAGHTVFSTHAGDTATFTVTPRWAHQSFALVMPGNVNRGEIQISVDGGAPTTVDTYAATAQDRKIVWQTRLSADTHTVVVTNLGTPGRKRVDIDAALLS